MVSVKLVDSERSYVAVLRSFWRQQIPFTLVEQDVVPQAPLDRLWDCPEPWCGFVYYRAGWIGPGFGTTCFKAKAFELVPDAFDVEAGWSENYRTQDMQFAFKMGLRKGGVQHRHYPPAIHLTQQPAEGEVVVELPEYL